MDEHGEPVRHRRRPQAVRRAQLHPAEAEQGPRLDLVQPRLAVRGGAVAPADPLIIEAAVRLGRPDPAGGEVLPVRLQAVLAGGARLVEQIELEIGGAAVEADQWRRAAIIAAHRIGHPERRIEVAHRIARARRRPARPQEGEGARAGDGGDERARDRTRGGRRGDRGQDGSKAGQLPPRDPARQPVRHPLRAHAPPHLRRQSARGEIGAAHCDTR
jgi:hypothetical protein